jgi:hypothetical protein
MIIMALGDGVTTYVINDVSFNTMREGIGIRHPAAHE